MSQALYRKWRSRTFDEVIGQEHVTQTLQNALHEGRVAHAYLFSGPRGTGKTSSARILAKALNCTAAEEERPCNQCDVCTAVNQGSMIDLVEIDAASNNSVDDVRELRDKVSFSPGQGQYKVYIIDEVHMLSTSAFNALLKTLEEPPPHVRFVLATTEPHKIPATVLSRCQRFDFRRIPSLEIADHLNHITQAEGFSAEHDALLAIGRSAQGCMRDAVSLLDQMLSYGQREVTLAQVQQVLGAVNAEAVSGLVDALATGQVAEGLALIQQLMIQGASLTEYCHQVIEHLRGVMVVQMTNDIALLSELPSEHVSHMQRQAQQMPLAKTLLAIKRFSAAIQDLKGGYQPQLPLELALIEGIQGAEIMAPIAAAPTPAQPVPSTVPQIQQQPAQPQIQSQAPPVETKIAETVAQIASTPVAQTVSIETAPVETVPVKIAPAPAPIDAESIRMLRQQWKEFINAVKQRCGIQVPAALNARWPLLLGNMNFHMI